MTRALMLALVAFVLLACGATPQQNARRVVDGVAIGVNVADIAEARAYADAARAALASSTTMAEYQAAMAGHDAAERALRIASDALELADAAVRIWDQGGIQQWPQALSCLVGALVQLQRTLEDAGVDVPPELVAALDMVHGLVSGDGCFLDAGVTP